MCSCLSREACCSHGINALMSWYAHGLHACMSEPAASAVWLWCAIKGLETALSYSDLYEIYVQTYLVSAVPRASSNVAVSRAITTDPDDNIP